MEASQFTLSLVVERFHEVVRAHRAIVDTDDLCQWTPLSAEVLHKLQYGRVLYCDFVGHVGPPQNVPMELKEAPSQWVRLRIEHRLTPNASTDAKGPGEIKDY